MLTVEQEAIIVAFRRHTLLPLDDCLYALQATIPDLTRSSLHRCLQRHGISRLPDVEGEKTSTRKFKAYPLGFFHIDIAEVRTEEGKLYLFVAIDRTTKFAFVELHEKATTRVSGDFLRHLIAAVPYKVHTVLTDNGIHFTTPGAGGSAVPLIKEAIANDERFRAHSFELACAQNDIEHRLTKPRHPWTNGQVERMNRTIKDATVSATTTTATNSSGSTSATSSPPTTSAAGSRPSKASHPTKPSAKHGRKNPTASPQIRTIKARDQTSKPNIRMLQSSRETILSILGGSSGGSIVCEGSTGACYPDVVYRPIHSEQGPALTSYSGYWREDNKNLALWRFLAFIRARYALSFKVSEN